ncbi:MAG: PrsW family intramembrane metalloprotease, partial [Spirochaetaceae bacterium]|nr:PrsW family intramembrane metalloprotease [Spirochaetaceae bacterium]
MTEIKGRKYLYYQPFNPAYWLFLLLLCLGVYLFTRQVSEAIGAYFYISAFAVLLWGVYSIPWFLFLINEELYDRQPAAVALLGFLWGGFIATFVMALEANSALIGILGKTVSPEFARDWGASISAPLVEELAKGLGIVTLVLLAKDRFRSIYDGIIIGAFTGLGFQVFEDLIYTFSAANLTAAGAEWRAVLSTFLGRGIVSGLWSHAMYSALVGAGIASYVLGRSKPFLRRFLRPAMYCFSAWGLHFLWDSPWVNGIQMAPVGMVIKLVLYPLLFSVGIYFALRRKRSVLSQVLAGEVSLGTLSEDDAKTVGESWRFRRKIRSGHRSSREIHNLQKAQRSLAVALARSERFEIIEEKR